MVDPNDGAELARRVAHDKSMETDLRHLEFQINYQTNKDQVMADKIRLTAMPGQDPTPSWLQDAARLHAQSVYKTQARTGAASSGGASSAGGRGGGGSWGAADQAGGPFRGRGRGRGRGKGKG